MRLLDVSTISFKEFSVEDGLRYAILSHRWEGEEISFQALGKDDVHQKPAFSKIARCCQEVAAAGLDYVWIDSCCIDKTSSADLSEAINTMYRWYAKATVCFAYLSDVHTIDDLQKSAWFSRGWTLQELIAPKIIRFYSSNWKIIGTKHEMVERLSEITGIPDRIFRGQNPDVCSVAQRMSWASRRVTTRPEDIAYSLMGLFDVNMPMLYGEGEKAFIRLQEEIIKNSDDQSVFAWSSKAEGPRGLLAPSPACFVNSGDTVVIPTESGAEQYSMTNVGLAITLPIIPWVMDTYLAVLSCKDQTAEKMLIPPTANDKADERLCIFLRRTPQDQQYSRVAVRGQDICNTKLRELESSLRQQKILVRQKMNTPFELERIYGFVFNKMAKNLFPNRSDGFNHFRIFSKGQVTESSRVDDYRLFGGDLAEAYRKDYNESVWTVEHPEGARGTVACFKLGVEGEQATSDYRRPDPVGLVKFGFDFDFRPVCMLWSVAWTTNSIVSNDRWIDEELVLTFKENPEQAGKIGDTVHWLGTERMGWTRS